MSNFKRRIRITCDPQRPFAHSVNVEDLSTGKAITDIKEATIYLKAGDVNTAKLTHIKREDGKPTREVEEAEVPEFDLSAFEPWLHDDIRELFVDALLADGTQHKQWYLWQLAETLGFHLDIDADKGIAP